MKFGWFQFLLVFALAFTIFSLYRIFNTSTSNEIDVDSSAQLQNYVKIRDTEILVDLADNDSERSRGLSGRANLPEGEGMLFVFEEEGIYPFWMKDMNFAIDIIWISRENRVVYIEKNVTPESYPKSFINDMPALYVLEVPALYSEQKGITLGDTVEFLSK